MPLLLIYYYICFFRRHCKWGMRYDITPEHESYINWVYLFIKNYKQILIKGTILYLNKTIMKLHLAVKHQTITTILKLYHSYASDQIFGVPLIFQK